MLNPLTLWRSRMVLAMWPALSVAVMPVSLRADEQPGGWPAEVVSVGQACGLRLGCAGDHLWIAPCEVLHQGRQIGTIGGSVLIRPADRQAVRDLRIKLVDGPVQSWRGGNRLRISAEDPRNVLPGGLIPDSLVIRDPARPEARFSAPADYALDATWAAFALSAGGSLHAGDEVLVDYAISLRRIDALILRADCEIEVIEGTPAVDCPVPPAVPDGILHLANIYRPFGAVAVLPAHIYPMQAACSAASQPVDEAKPSHSAALDRVLTRLRAGEPITIVCWGDSVTQGGDASTPDKNYVGQFTRMLGERFPAGTINVVNAGIGGTTTAGRWPSFQKEVLDHRPDVVTLEFVNDMGTPLDQLQARYTEILSAVRSAGAELVLITPHFTMPAWMGLPDGRGADPRPAVAFLRRFAAENHLPLADASRRWEQLEAQGIPYETLLKNGINHPDDRGHLIFAEELMHWFPAR